MNEVTLKGKLSKIKTGTSQKGNFYYFSTLEIENGKYPLKVDLKCFEKIDNIDKAKDGLEATIKGNLVRLKGTIKNLKDNQYAEANLLCVNIKEISVKEQQQELFDEIPQGEFSYDNDIF